MDDEGIYRKAGIKSAVEGVCALFEERGDSNNPVDLSVEPDINAVTGCLKGFFRNVCFSAAVAFFLVFFFFFSFSLFFSSSSSFSVFSIPLHQLPEPLVPYQLYSPLIALANQSNPPNMAFAGVLGDFPSFNFEVIKSLIEHLKRVAGHSDTNMMKASNLSIIFGPNLLRSKESEANPLVALADNSQQSKVVEILIDHLHPGHVIQRYRSSSLRNSFLLGVLSHLLVISQKKRRE